MSDYSAIGLNLRPRKIEEYTTLDGEVIQIIFWPWLRIYKIGEKVVRPYQPFKPP